MLKYSIKRVILAFVTTFIILTLTFFLVKSLGPARLVGSAKVAEKITFYETQCDYGYVLEFFEPHPELGETIEPAFTSGTKTYYFYEKPIVEQYAEWLKNIVTKFDWGQSTRIKPGSDAINIIMQRLPTSLKINIIAMVVSVPLGIALGILAGLKKNTWIDHTISTSVMIFISIPSFVVIIFLLYWFAYNGSLPTKWPTSDKTDSMKALGYIIPVLSLSFGSICGYCRFVRAELCEVMSSEYLLLARTKGLTKRQAILRHALRNAFVPILPSILAEFIGIFSGSMILEQIYNINGIGSLYIDALSANNAAQRDLNVLMVDMAIFTIVGLLAGVILDLSYGFIDPRIRMGEKNA